MTVAQKFPYIERALNSDPQGLGTEFIDGLRYATEFLHRDYTSGVDRDNASVLERLEDREYYAVLGKLFDSERDWDTVSDTEIIELLRDASSMHLYRVLEVKPSLHGGI